MTSTPVNNATVRASLLTTLDTAVDAAVCIPSLQLLRLVLKLIACAVFIRSASLDVEQADGVHARQQTDHHREAAARVTTAS